MQGLGYSSLALGVYLSLRIFNIPDITTDGSYTLGGAVTAVMLANHFNPFYALCICIIAGMIAGAITGAISTRLKIQPLLAGILVMTALYSVNLQIMGRSNIPLINTTDIFSYFSSNNTYGRFITLLIVTVVLLLLLSWLLKTDFGIAMRATGNSESMVRAMGVNTSAMKIAGLALANGFTALSGFLLTQYQGFADINMGMGIVISGLGSVMIGEAVLKRWLKKAVIYNIIAVITGSILFRLIIAAALSSGLDPNYLRLVTALIVLFIVAFAHTRKSAQ
jgi:putative tryptophan/tyrosine transport system permease protein